jgi:dTDP-4-dehydrorhamnose 3,5-epimerase
VRFEGSPLAGVWIVEPELLTDARGWFARTFDVDEFRARGLDLEIVQCSASYNSRGGTIRGMHYQAEPHGESKLVRCVRGAVFDVVVDLRSESSTRCRWHGVELNAENRRALYIPTGFAHGFQTLQDDCEVLYQMGGRYVPEAARGVRWDDPSFTIEWPSIRGERTISERDRGYPNFAGGG